MSSSLIEQCSPSAYSTIIDKTYYKSTQITQLNDSDELVQLHRNFWLQSVQDVPENESMNVDKGEDADEDEDEADETGPGCYILNLGVPRIQRSVLWVRKEYIRLYGYWDKYLESHRDEHKAPSVVITGQPSIGKPFTVRLAEGKPVVWFRAEARYLFVVEGAFEIPSGYPSTKFKTRVWMFLDAGDCIDGIPDYFAAHKTKYLIIVSSAPRVTRWKLFTKTTQCSLAIMNPWTREEISRAVIEANDPRIDEMYNQYGPTPGICLESLGLVTDGDGDNKFSYGRLEPMSHMVKLGLRNQLRKETRAARIALYKSLANVEGTTRIAGIVYESLAQEMLEKKIALKLVPMAKRGSSGSGRGKKLSRWDSNHGDGANPSLVRIDIAPMEMFVYPASGLDYPIKDMVFYAPSSKPSGDRFVNYGRRKALHFSSLLGQTIQ
ncbi:hypothetical protein H4582DRAFT_2071690 [Lactarius indigo]|nr:hypothetical protein H4582DRAFT_2071690 [Lactarius indigo]